MCVMLIASRITFFFFVTVQVMYGGTSQARTVVRDHEFYFPKGHNKMIGISGESRQDRIKFDVILTSYEMINVDTEVLKPIKWKCMVFFCLIIMVAYTFTVFSLNLIYIYMLLINHFYWLDC